MKAGKIRSVFAAKNIRIPTEIEESISGEEYEDYQEWCCGLHAVESGDSVVVRAYCWRGRITPRQYTVLSDGSYTEEVVELEEGEVQYGPSFIEEDPYEEEPEDEQEEVSYDDDDTDFWKEVHGG
ncbi:MAG: hypothetical protein Q8P30_03350 [Candidatus Uhrbacteria bacterium]|nr:hypothetical protein [Candidatus Uhrbacteria bacterium]